MQAWRARIGAVLIGCGILFWVSGPAAAEPRGAEDGVAAEQVDGEAEGETAPPSEPSAGAETSAEESGQPELHRKLDRASDFAPAGVILDHTHERGDWTFSYRYEHHEKSDLLVGADEVAVGEVGQRYPLVPRSQTIDVHTFGVMYAPRDRFTFALSLPYIEKQMDLIQNGTIPQQMRSRGIGDAQLIFLIPFIQKAREKTHLRFGMSFPTGSIQERDENDLRLPYPMQLGSGTWDVHWGITYTGVWRWLSWGSQFESEYRLGTNDVGYRLGTTYQASIWMTGGLGDWVSVSGRLGWKRRGNVHDVDPDLDKNVSPINDNMRQGGTRLELGPGVNLLIPFFGGQRLAFEALFPIYQNLDGPQLAHDVSFTAGWQWIF